MSMFNFLTKLKSHKTAEDKIQRIVDKGQTKELDKEGNVKKQYTTEFGEFYEKNGAIRIDGFFNEATNYLTSNIYDLEHKQSINKYRYMSTLPEVDAAIEEIVNEAIVLDDKDEDIVKIDFKDDEVSENLKEIINQEFEYIRDILLDFRVNGSRLFRQWYVDGVLYMEKVFNEENIREGIEKLNILDAYYVTYYMVLNNINIKSNYNAGSIDYFMKREVEEEFFLIKKPNFNSTYYQSSGFYSMQRQGVLNDVINQMKVPVELVCYVDSGIYHPQKYYPYSYLHKALKVSNQLTLLEDALLIYRITRAPERRIFYIEVGAMPPNKAEEYMRKLMRQYRQDKTYDVQSGTMSEKGMFMAMTEDFWLPRRQGQSSTEVTTLPGGQNLSEIEDLKYFANKIWTSLNVPYTRRADKTDNGGTSFNSGRELTIEELKFYKYILKIRKQFSKLFDDLLGTQLVLKRIVNSEEVDVVLSKVKYIFNNDNYFSRFLRFDVINSQLEIINSMDAHVGKYFSRQGILKDVLEKTDDEIKQLNQEITSEKEMMAEMSGEEGGEGGEAPGGMGGGEMPPPPAG